jgi:hypothetical protein
MFYMICLGLMLTACGGSDIAASVAYEGTTLVVKGVWYERPAGIDACEAMNPVAICRATSSRPAYASKTVIIQMNTADEKFVTDLLTGYGLSITRRSELSAVAELPALTTLVVTVPLLFEEQWVQALRSEFRIGGAWTNDLVHLS